ncbi:MAG: response regulator, partial [Sporomusaceae bacterium]|nr:response regulator [Sporomusaceae bacterium]
MTNQLIKVAVADDNREFTNILKETISRETDINLVGIAHNGEEMLAILEEKLPDVIVLDLIMPRLDGIGVLEKINASTFKRPKIIMLTAFGQESITQKTVELGADYYILKPFNIEVLISRIRQLAGFCATARQTAS